MAALKEIFKISKGKKEEETEEGSKLSRRYIQIEDLRQNDNLKYCIPNKKSVHVNKDDLIIAWDGANAGTIGVGLEGVIGSTLARLELKNNKVNPYYAARFLQSKFQYLRDNCTGATIPHISKTVLENLSIPLPPLETQKRVVEVMDKAQRLIDARKEQIRLMDELIQSVFYEMFGDPVGNSMKWPLYLLGELCKVGSSKRIYQSEQTISGVPFLRISDLINRIEVGSETCDLFISPEKFEELKQSGLVPKVGEILVTSRGTLGECYIVNDADNFYFQDGMISWLSNISDLVLPEYILYLFKTQGIKRQIDGFQAGSTVAYLSITMLKQLEIMLPTIEVQRQFICFIQKVDKLKVDTQKSLDEIYNNYNSIMQKAFKGDLFGG